MGGAYSDDLKVPLKFLGGAYSDDLIVLSLSFFVWMSLMFTQEWHHAIYISMWVTHCSRSSLQHMAVCSCQYNQQECRKILPFCVAFINTFVVQKVGLLAHQGRIPVQSWQLISLYLQVDHEIEKNAKNIGGRNLIMSNKKFWRCGNCLFQFCIYVILVYLKS